MALGTEIAEAANSAPPESICHRAVVHWLVKGNAITAGDQTKVGSATRADGWGAVLAAKSDKAYTKGDLGTAAAGTVIGFFTKDGTLQHSMVSMGGGLLAGVNNLNVLSASVGEKVGINYARVTVDQLNWVDNSRVGINQCEVRGAAPDVVAKRIKG
jgi:hypothetical protein